VSYIEARAAYAAAGVNTDEAIRIAREVPLSLHCWQGDDVTGFDRREALSGGILVTGAAPGKARTPAELMADISKAFSLIPGPHKLNLHASYAIFGEGAFADRDALLPEHYAPWVDFAKERGIGLDFNPTFFSHPLAASGLTLSSPDERVRAFWVEHGKRCVEVAGYFARETGQPCVLNIWVPDGMKDTPGDRMSPRRRFARSLDEILSVPHDKDKVVVTLESKVFGIGAESFTVGSAEFCLAYAASRGITPLLDNGHYHPTESVADKISALLLFFSRIALHLTRGVRWDSDHVVLFDDETRAILSQVVTCGALGRVFLATDFFDASVNRIAAWVTGARAVRKALLWAALLPAGKLRALQDAGDTTRALVLREELNTLPFADVWGEYLRVCGIPQDFLPDVEAYEKKVTEERGA
jgi:L-rhamnose isomerase